MADVWPVTSPIGIVALKPCPTQFFAYELSRKQSDYAMRLPYIVSLAFAAGIFLHVSGEHARKTFATLENELSKFYRQLTPVPQRTASWQS